MDGFNGPGGLERMNNHQDLKQADSNSQGNDLFDASQYAFFGNNVLEEVELGGLDDEDEDLPPPGVDSEEYPLEQEEEDLLTSYSDVDDLTTSFSKLNKAGVNPGTAFFGDRESRESSSAADYVQEEDFPDWYDQRGFNLDAERNEDCQRGVPLHPYSSSLNPIEPRPLYRTLSYPDQEVQQQQQQQQRPPTHHHHYSSEAILIPKSSYTSFPPPGGAQFFQGSPNNLSSTIYRPGAHHIPVSSPNISTFSSSSRNQMNPMHHGSQYGGGIFPQLSPNSPQINNHIQNQRMNQLPHRNGMLPQKFQTGTHNHPFQSPFGSSALQPQRFNHNQHPHQTNNFELTHFKDQRAESMLRSGRYGGMGMRSGWPIFKAKYMSPDEIENILRIQIAATHSNDPYVDDYYHQACLAKKSVGAKLRHHFCPTNLRDGSSQNRSNTEKHAFLQVDALGRVSFSSIHRPRPLLEVDTGNSSANSSSEPKVSEKPLEEEPMLVARVTIEDGICLLLDVDDIDRFLQFNQFPDRVEHLNKKRQHLLEGLASSLQLVDPVSKKGQSINISPKDDLMFLRVVTLPKGRKLLSRYLQLIFAGSELGRVVCMAIFRNLRFLFGHLPADIVAVETTKNLAMAVSSFVRKMDLTVVSACLASVVCSTDHPPLRPIGSPLGDGASVVLKSALERATELLRDPQVDTKCDPQSRMFWQASFNAFFDLVTKYCFNKYDQSFAAGSDVGSEIPVGLLHASLPHTSEQQRKLLMDFAQRSIPAPGGDVRSD